MAATARPDAARPCSVTWAASRPMAANEVPTEARPSPRTTEPPSGRSWAASSAAEASPTTSEAPPATARAAALWAWRPSTAARSSSARPASSSWRVWRTTVSRPSRAKASAICQTSNATRPPKVPSPRAGPDRATRVALPSAVRA